MSSTEDAGRRFTRALAVDEAYHALEKYQVNRQRIAFLDNDEIRAGGYGIVRQAYLHSSSYLPTWFASSRYGPPQVVAVKEIKLSAMHNVPNLKRAFTKEVLVWSSLEEHPGIAKFLGFCADFGRMEAWLISPWEPHGNVSEFIQGQGRELEVPEKLSLVYDTIDALAFLHQLNPPVCHGDIKAANVLVNNECRAVLCDFGLARLYEDSGFGRLETSTGFKGSIRWCSPELLDGQSRTASSDVYAWAWLVWEIMTGQLPYGEASADYVIMRKIFESPRPQVNGELRLSDCLQVWELMTRCWAVQPGQRPTSAMCKTTIDHLPHCPPVLETADPHARSAALLEHMGELERWKGNHTEAFAYLEQALHLYEEEGNDRGIANVLRKQAAVACYNSDNIKAMESASAALERFKSLKDDVGIAHALSWMGVSLIRSGQLEKASSVLLESLEIFRTKRNQVGVVRCLERLGEIHHEKGQLIGAFSALEEAIDIASHCGYRVDETRALTVLGAVHMRQGDLDKAMATLQKGHEIGRSIGWEQGVSSSICRMGIIKLVQGLNSEGEELLREAVAIARRSGGGWRLAQALHYLGRCHLHRDELQDATLALEESYLIYQELAFAPDPGFAQETADLAGIMAAQGDTGGALTWYERAIALFREMQNKPCVSRYLAERGQVLLTVGRNDQGALHFEASMTIDRELGNDYGVEWNRNKISSIPKTPIEWEVRRRARLALAKVQTLRTTSLLCDVKKLLRRVPQLTTPYLKLRVKLVDKRDS